MLKTVYYTTTASYGIDVEVPDDTPEDEINDVARDLAEDKRCEEAPPTLCYHCSKLDLGEFEQDDSEYGVM